MTELQPIIPNFTLFFFLDKTKFYTCRPIRASSSVRLYFLSILQRKTYFFYFTNSLLQNTHINLFILHVYSIKYSLFYNFLFFTPSLPLSLSQTHGYHHHHHHHPAKSSPPNRRQDHQNPPMNQKSQADQDQNPPTHTHNQPKN